MSIEEKIAEIVWVVSTDTQSSNMTEQDKEYYGLIADKILSLIQIEVKCPQCIGNGWTYTDSNAGRENCSKCKGTGKITKFPESGDRGEIL